MPEQSDLSGRVHAGRGLAVGRMTDFVVLGKLEELSGFRVVPDTLSVRLPGPLVRVPSWWYLPAVEIALDWESRTGQSGYCVAAVTVANCHRGLAFQAVEWGERRYPPDQIELFCEVQLRAELGLEDGEVIDIRLRGGSPAVAAGH